MVRFRVGRQISVVAFGCLLFLFPYCSDIPFAIAKRDYIPNSDLRLHNNHKNYFLKAGDVPTRQMVRNVNRHHLKKAIRHLTSGKPERAIAELKFVLRYVPNHPQGLQLMGVVGKLTNRTKLVEQYYAQAIRVFPQYALTHAQFGKFLVDIGRVEDGIEELQKAQSIQPDLKTVFVWLSEAYQKNGDIEEAKMAEERVKELEEGKKNSSKP